MKMEIMGREGHSKSAIRPKVVVVDPTKTVLVIVDMQNEFVNPRGKIYTGPSASRSVARISKLLNEARRLGMRVVHVMAVYDKGDPRFSEHPKAKFDKGGCLAGSWGAEIVPELAPLPSEPVVRKASYDCWFNTTMEDTLRKVGLGYDHDISVHRNRAGNDFSAVITGTVSNVCVEKAVIGFFLRGYQVIVPSDCISAKSRYAQEWALRQFTSLYRAKITSSRLLRIQGKETNVVKSKPLRVIKSSTL